jgi:hypothetical protein
MEEQKFDLWCMVELFGHQKIAGRCTEQNVAGTNMLRVDVPETANQPGFTRFLSSGAIYAINPVTEEVARKLAGSYNVAPVDVWSARRIFEDEIKALRSGEKHIDDDLLEE